MNLMVKRVKELLKKQSIEAEKLQSKIKKQTAKSKSKFKFKIEAIIQDIQLLIIKTVKFIVNIDITPIFIFAASYAISTDFPWYYRIIASIGIYIIYKMLIKDIKEITIIRGQSR